MCAQYRACYPSSFFILRSNMKYVTYGRSVVESKIMAKEKERRERDGEKEEREKAVRDDGDIISVKSRNLHHTRRRDVYRADTK